MKLEPLFSREPRIAELVRSQFLPSLREAPSSPGEPLDLSFLRSIREDELLAVAETTFWASLDTEEARHYFPTLCLAPPEHFLDPLPLDKPHPLDRRSLMKLAPAIDSESCIGVWRRADGRGLEIWGFSPTLDDLFVPRARALRAGQLVLSYANAHLFLSGERVVLIDPLRFFLAPTVEIPDDVPADGDLWENDEFVRRNRRANQSDSDLREAAQVMIRHGCGGTLLVVQKESDWRASIDLGSFTPREPYVEIKNALQRREDPLEVFNRGSLGPYYQQAARRALRLLGRMTAVDGATVVSRELEVLSIGAKIRVRGDASVPPEVLCNEPFELSLLTPWSMNDLGGMRHRSTALFVSEHHDALALVASTDRHLSFFHWDEEEGMVCVTRNAQVAL